MEETKDILLFVIKANAWYVYFINASQVNDTSKFNIISMCAAFSYLPDTQLIFIPYAKTYNFISCFSPT